MHPKELFDAYQKGENIVTLLKESLDSDNNSEEIIEISYDLQNGSYIKALENPDMYQQVTNYGKAIADEMLALTSVSSVLEPGIGEGTTMSFVLNNLGDNKPHAHGFDISWSRIACCRSWLESQGHPDVYLSIGSLLQLPYCDSCFDVVYTSHTIEPNGGAEKAILNELYRVTSKYLILLEPGYELANQEAKQRMDKHGYCRNLVKTAESLGFDVIKHELFPYTSNPLNPTAITIIVKNADASPQTPKLACPSYQCPLTDYGNSLYAPDSLRAYPKIQGIPCLRPQDGIIASAYPKFNV